MSKKIGKLNAIPYALPAWGMAATALEERLAVHPARAPFPTQRLAMGWAPVLEGVGGPWVLETEGALWTRAEIQERKLPATALKQAVAAEIARREQGGTRVGKKEKAQIRDEVEARLLPSIPPVATAIDLCIDPKSKLLWVFTSSATKAETLLKLLRTAAGSLPVRALATAHDPAREMAAWLRRDDFPAGFEAGVSGVLEDPEAKGSTVSFTRTLCAPDVQHHLDAGKVVRQLSLRHASGIVATVTRSLAVRQFTVEDGALEEQEYADAAEQAAAYALLKVRLLREWWPALLEAFGGAVRVEEREGDDV